VTRQAFSIVLTLLLLFSSVAPACAEVLAYGTRDSYWLVQIRRESNGEVQSTVVYRPVGSAASWKAIARINAPLRSVARLGTNLAALMDDGQWMQVWNGGSTGGAVPEDGSKLIELAGSDDTLWAIALAGAGRSSPTTAGATQPAATMPRDTRLLYRLEQSQWRLVTMLPNRAQDARSVSLRTMSDGLMLAAMGEQGQVDVFRLDRESESWQSLGTASFPAQTARVKLLANLDRPTIWGISPGSAGVIAWRETDGDWSAPVALTAAEIGDGADDATVAGRSIRLLVETDGKISEYPFDRNGQSQGTPVTVAIPRAPQEPSEYEWLTGVAAAALLIVIMNTMRRREPVTPESLQAAGLQLAPYIRRLFAGLIDAVPVIGTIAVVISRAEGEDPEQIELAMDSARTAIYLSAGIYILHTTLFELLWGWSIGKRLFGLRVVMIDGTPPIRRAIILRNLLRVLDVMIYFAPLLLMLVSPLRQRIGDIVGETIVIRDG
jgi:uncharacterized RDD family membrane protein YckC